MPSGTDLPRPRVALLHDGTEVAHHFHRERHAEPGDGHHDGHEDGDLPVPGAGQDGRRQGHGDGPGEVHEPLSDAVPEEVCVLHQLRRQPQRLGAHVGVETDAKMM